MAFYIVRSRFRQNSSHNNASSHDHRSQLHQDRAKWRDIGAFNLCRAGLFGLLFCCFQIVVFGQSTPTLTSPIPGSVLSSSATLKWTAAPGATQYSLYVGTAGPGSFNLYNSGGTTATSLTVTGIPANGVTVYVRLRWYLNGAWQCADYTYTESGTSTPPSLTSPAPGSVLGSSATFKWNPGAGPAEFMLYLGTAGPGSINLYNSGGITATSVSLSSLPKNGVIVYARLSWYMNGAWQHTDYTYTEGGAPAPPSLTSPTPGSVLGSSATFTWNPGAGAAEYSLYIGTAGPGSFNLYNSGGTTATSVAVSGIPNNGVTIYARLRWYVNGVWQYNDYTYAEAGTSTPASLISPAPGSVLGSSATFTWNPGAGPAEFMFYLGTTGAGSSNLYNSGGTTVTSVSVSGLPNNRATLYARLSWYMNGAWQHADYTYTEASPAPSLSSLICTNNSMTGAGTDACTVALTGAAPSGGVVVSLASNNAAVVGPASVTIAAGSSTASFTATVSAVTTSQTATLMASAGGVSESFALQLNAAVPTLSLSASSLAFGEVDVNTSATQSVTLTSSGTASVTISAAAITGAGFSFSGLTFPLTLTPGQSAILSVQFAPAIAGTGSGQLTLTSDSSSNGTAAIGLTGTGLATLSALSCMNASMTGAGADACTVTLNTAAPSGGVTMSLASDNSAVSVPASVTVASGSTSASFTANVSAVTATQTATLTATEQSDPQTFALRLNAAAPTVSNVSPNGGPTAGGTGVTITGTNFAAGATVAFGGAAATNVVVVNSTTLTATTPSGSAGAVTVTVTNSGTLCGSLANGFTYAAATAIAYVQGNYATPQSPQTSVKITFANAQTAGNLNVVVVGWNDSTAVVNSVTDTSGNTYALAVGPTLVSGTLSQSIYYAKNIAAAAAGTNAVTVTFSVAAVYPDIRALEYSGADLSLPVDVSAAGSGTSATSTSATANTSNPTDLVFGANIVATGTTGAGSGFTKRLLTSPDGDLAEDKMVTTTGAYSATAPLSSPGAWIMQMVAFRTPSAPQAPPALSSVSCSTGSIAGAGTDACSVALTAAAPSGGFTVTLASNNSAVTLPGSLTVAAGSSSASFTASVAAVTSAQTATLTATASGISQSFALQLNAAVPTLSLSASSLAFGSVAINTPSTQTVTLTSSGTTAVTVSAATITGVGFSTSGVTFPLTLNPGQSAALKVQFDPTTAGAASGQLTLTSNSSTGGTAAIGLSGTGMVVLTALNCSSNSMTGAGTDACTVTLNAGAPSGGLAVALASNNSAVTLPASLTIAAGSSSASFTATVAAVTSAQTVTLTATAGSVSQSFALQLNTSNPVLNLNATNISFGDVPLNSPATQSVILTSSGGSSVTVSSAAITGTGFTMSGITPPLTLNPGQTATLNVQFDPTTAASMTGQVSVVSNSSSNPTAIISLSGTGQAASSSVDLSWTAPSSSPDPVSGYNIYRATGSSSSYQLLNSTADISTTYADTTVASGTSYTYYVESVDAAGCTSGPSNSYTVAIP